MRYPDGSLLGDLGDGRPAYTSGSLAPFASTSINENNTTYDLLPVIVNQPPVIEAGIYDASIPDIKPFAAVSGSSSGLYLHSDGTVKARLGASFSLALTASQPDVLNVDNGLLVMKVYDQELSYIWRKDGRALEPSSSLERIGGSISISGSKLTISNIQPMHAGTYVCEVSNDIGTTVSEDVTIEVTNPDVDAYFFNNLVQNPYGKDGIDGWTSLTGELISKEFSGVDSARFKEVNNIDTFGYTIDMLHPRPYQIYDLPVRNLKMSDNIRNRGSYFTRSRLKYHKAGGSFLVTAYQDVDLSDIEAYIKGGVYGVDGVRAFFSCYIGNGVGRYHPNERTIRPADRKEPTRYDLGKPRLSHGNFEAAGPGFVTERIYVMVEEYDKETRLISTVLTGSVAPGEYPGIRVDDPWNKRLPGKSVVEVAEALYPSEGERYTFGQYGEFIRVVFNQLNRNTNKVRIKITFEANDIRVFDGLKDWILESDEVFDLNSWDRPYAFPSTSSLASSYAIEVLNAATPSGTPLIRKVPLAGDPRAMITAINFVLIPLDGTPRVDFYTQNLLTGNGLPVSSVPSVLDPDSLYDPYGDRTTDVKVLFEHWSVGKSFKDFSGGGAGIKRFFIPENINLDRTYIRFRIESGSALNPVLGIFDPLVVSTGSAVFQRISGGDGYSWSINAPYTPSPSEEVSTTWNRKARFVLEYENLPYFQYSGTGQVLYDRDPVNENRKRVQQYYLDVDFSSGTGSFTIWRDGSLYGSGSLPPISMPAFVDTIKYVGPTGPQDLGFAGLYFDLPPAVLALSYENGGLGVEGVADYGDSETAAGPISFARASWNRTRLRRVLSARPVGSSLSAYGTPTEVFELYETGSERLFEVSYDQIPGYFVNEGQGTYVDKVSLESGTNIHGMWLYGGMAWPGVTSSFLGDLNHTNPQTPFNYGGGSTTEN